MRSEPASWQPETDAPDQVAHLWCTTLPPGIISGHGSVCAHEGGPTRAGESMREAMSRPACGSVTGPRGGGRSSTATLLDGDRCTRPPHPRTLPGGTRAAVEEARAGRRGPWAWGRIEGIEGVRGWASWPREIGRIGVERGGGRTRRGEGSGAGAQARATVAGETRQFAVGHGRAERSRGRSPWRGQAGVLTSWRWARMVPRDRRQPPTGRHDGTEGRPDEWREGRRQEGGLLSPSNISRVQVHPPVPACIYIYIYVCMYV